MSDNSMKVGAGVGLAVGAGAGVVKGMKKAAEIMKPFIGTDGKPDLDTYVKSRVNANEADIMKSFTSGKKITDAFKRVAAKAKEDFEPALEKAIKNAKTTKVKSIALMALAGTAIGAGIAFVVDKIKAAKAQKAE